MPRVTFLPDNHTVDVRDGLSILDAAELADFPIKHNCGGNCACSTCHVIIEEGVDNLSALEEDEEERLDQAVELTMTSRLACQALIEGDVVVTVPDTSREDV